MIENHYNITNSFISYHYTSTPIPRHATESSKLLPTPGCFARPSRKHSKPKSLLLNRHNVEPLYRMLHTMFQISAKVAYNAYLGEHNKAICWKQLSQMTLSSKILFK